MSGAPSAYPLQWPAGYPRTQADRRQVTRFNRKERDRQSGRMNMMDLTVADALQRLQGELDAIHARYAVVSSNVELRLDGRPRSGQKDPIDPGIAVYFQHRGRPTCLPCDRYTTAAGNIAAIAAHIEATRAIERHGVATVEQMFTGFQAIRGPGPKPWREVLGFKLGEPVSRDAIAAKRREMARTLHPDAGGDAAAMAQVNEAADAGMREVSAP